MSVFVGRDGNISTFRIGLLLSAVGVLAIIGGYVIFQLDVERRRSPLFIDLYPNAEEWFTQDLGGAAQKVVYRVADTEPETVASFYQAEFDDGYRDEEDRDNAGCVRTPIIGEFPDYEEGSGNLPYFYRCVFDDSTLGAVRFTTVTIEPGLRNDNAEQPYDNTGMTVITYEQVWTN